jgi:hypothetical protein
MGWQCQRSDDGEDTGEVRKMGRMMVMLAVNVIMIMLI